jgi:HEAT repeat protein
MLNWLANIFGWRFDWPEFLLGGLMGLLAAWGLRRLLPMLLDATTWTKQRAQTVSEGFTAAAKDRYREELVRRVETLHLARAILALEEIAVAPRLLAPPTPADPTRTEPQHEGSLAVLPNLPESNVLFGIYRSPTLSLAEALAGGAHLLITGDPGTGKSTALAYLALKAARRDPEVGLAAEMLPVLVHANDLRLDHQPRDPMTVLIDAAQLTVSGGLAARLPGYLRNHARQGRVLLLLDGLDELTTEELKSVAAWIKRFVGVHAGNRVVAAGPVRGYDGVVEAGLAPVPLAPWTEHEHRQFLQRWGAGWQKYVAPGLPKNRIGDLDPALITGWLIGLIRTLTPFEATMRVWAAYAGDARGGVTAEGIEAYLARFLSPDERQVAEVVGTTWIKERLGCVPERILARGTPVSDLIDAGILAKRFGARVSFAHPALGAYLAARGFIQASLPEPALLDGWAPAEACTHWIAALGDVTSEAERHLRVSEDPLAQHLLLCGRWLKDAQPKAPWRPYVLRALATVLHDLQRPYGLRLRAAHALVLSREATVTILFRRLLTSDAPSSRILGALGLGALRDEEAVEPLLKLVADDPHLFCRQAACLGLAAIGTQPALEGLGSALLTGDEGVRLGAGEALACHPDEGYGMLRDALEVDNLLTRRAAVFGLSRVPEAWALEALEKLQVEDGQWIVRGAAAEGVERRKNPPWKIQPPVSELAEVPWLVAYATREGLGVAPGRPALEMARRVLSNGTPGEKLAALEAIASAGSEEFNLELSAALRSDDPQMRDAGYEALWRLTASSAALPATAAANA